MSDEYSNDESEDNMSVDDAKCEVDSEVEADKDEEEYETITVSEAAPDEQRYDQDIDTIEEKAAIEKLKRMFVKLTKITFCVLFDSKLII